MKAYFILGLGIGILLSGLFVVNFIEKPTSAVKNDSKYSEYLNEAPEKKEALPVLEKENSLPITAETKSKPETEKKEAAPEKAVQEITAAERPVEEKPVENSNTENKFYVQVASSTSVEDSERLIKKVKDYKLMMISRGNHFIIMTEKFRTKEEAQQVRDEIEAKYKENGMVIKGK